MKYLISMLIIPFLLACVTNSNKVELPIESELVDLEYLVRKQHDTTKRAPLLVLLHGYGSNEEDIFSFSDKIPDNWLLVSVRAPIALGSNRYKWYDVKFVGDNITINYEDEEKSRQSLLLLIDQVISKYNVNKSKIVTAGFSQGANMALGLALTEPNKVKAAACFSGRFMEGIKPLISNKEALTAKQVFIAHGTEDQMLPLKYAEENQHKLEQLGMEVTLITDKVAHTISTKQLYVFAEWLKDLI